MAESLVQILGLMDLSFKMPLVFSKSLVKAYLGQLFIKNYKSYTLERSGAKLPVGQVRAAALP
jgi:hypothetical protein